MPLGIKQNNNLLYLTLDVWQDLVFLNEQAYPAGYFAANIMNQDQATLQALIHYGGAISKEAEALLNADRDTFARLLQGAAPGEGKQDRVLSQLLYQLGRWIYLVDARDDMEEDRAAGRYNPVIARFGPQGDDENLRRTLDHSLGLMGAALQLGEFGCRTPILENILYLGLPMVQRAVFDGSWREIKKQKIWSNN